MLIHTAVFLFLELMKFSGIDQECSSKKSHCQRSAFHTCIPGAWDLQESWKNKQCFRYVKFSFRSLKSSRKENMVDSYLTVPLSHCWNNSEALPKASLSLILHASPNTEVRSNLRKQTHTKLGLEHFSTHFRTHKQILN